MKKKISSAFLFLSLFIGFSYSNTLDSSWHLDDIPNIINNVYIHLDTLSLKSLLNSLYSNPSNPYEINEKMYRPVACISLALNWYLGKDNVFGYHLVNIGIHIISSFSLFMFLLNLFQSPRLRKHFYGFDKPDYQIFLVAFLASLFWAVHPIHTQAVTYIVQRMASLSGMFYIIGMLVYVKGRLSSDTLKRWIWYLSCGICFVLSVNSKENGIMLPGSLLLVEIIFFQDISDIKKVRKFFIYSLLTGATLCLLALWVLFNNNFLLKLYEQRTFSVLERLLAQPRVLVFHLSQIFFPLPERFSIAHDFRLSSSLIEPWTNLPAIFIIFSLIGFGLYKGKQHPLFSFAILFFFLNHIIESSVLPLEIVFEHRNYLPSMFLFLPVSFGLSKLLDRYYHQKKRLMLFITIAFTIAIPIWFSVSTHIRNKIWKNEILLWTDAYKKAPNNARVLDILGINLAWGGSSNHPNRYDMAITLFEKALTLQMPSTAKKADILGNLASVYSTNKKDYKKAVQLYEEALVISPENMKIRLDMVNTLILMGNYSEALQSIEILMLKNNNNWVYHNIKGFCLLWLGKYVEAFPNFQQALRLVLKEKNTFPKGLLLNMGITLSLKGEYQLANDALEGIINEETQKNEIHLDNLPIYFALIENSLRANDDVNARKYFSQMVTIFGKETVLENMDKIVGNRILAPISKKILDPVRAELEMQ